MRAMVAARRRPDRIARAGSGLGRDRADPSARRYHSRRQPPRTGSCCCRRAEVLTRFGPPSGVRRSRNGAKCVLQNPAGAIGYHTLPARRDADVHPPAASAAAPDLDAELALGAVAVAPALAPLAEGLLEDQLHAPPLAARGLGAEAVEATAALVEGAAAVAEDRPRLALRVRRADALRRGQPRDSGEQPSTRQERRASQDPRRPPPGRRDGQRAGNPAEAFVVHRAPPPRNQCGSEQPYPATQATAPSYGAPRRSHMNEQRGRDRCR